MLSSSQLSRQDAGATECNTSNVLAACSSVDSNTNGGMPAIFFQEALHGAEGDTIFPSPAAMGSSWEPSLLERVLTAVAAGARALGSHVVLAPVLDLFVDPRFGRLQEGFGEDPMHVAAFARSAALGLQGAPAASGSRSESGGRALSANSKSSTKTSSTHGHKAKAARLGEDGGSGGGERSAEGSGEGPPACWSSSSPSRLCHCEALCGLWRRCGWSGSFDGGLLLDLSVGAFTRRARHAAPRVGSKRRYAARLGRPGPVSLTATTEPVPAGSHQPHPRRRRQCCGRRRRFTGGRHCPGCRTPLATAAEVSAAAAATAAAAVGWRRRRGIAALTARALESDDPALGWRRCISHSPKSSSGGARRPQRVGASRGSTLVNALAHAARGIVLLRNERAMLPSVTHQARSVTVTDRRDWTAAGCGKDGEGGRPGALCAAQRMMLGSYASPLSARRVRVPTLVSALRSLATAQEAGSSGEGGDGIGTDGMGRGAVVSFAIGARVDVAVTADDAPRSQGATGLEAAVELGAVGTAAARSAARRAREEAAQLARRSDVVILALGDTSRTAGEWADRSSLERREIGVARSATQRGTPVVLVVVGGRPVWWPSRHDAADGQPPSCLTIHPEGHRPTRAI